MKDKISVIVPIYNVEKFLKRCLDSIINQTYNNLEIILINDGSPDDCHKICEEYKNKDERIIYISKKNEGVSATRNIGLEIASGEYIAFVDSDDYIENDMFEVLYNDLIKYDADLSYCQIINRNVVPFNDNILMTSQEALEILVKPYKGLEGYSCNKLYKKSIIDNNNIRFNKDILFWEDIYFVCEYLNCCEKNIVSVNKKLYFYENNENNVSNECFGPGVKTSLLALEKMEKIYKDKAFYDTFLARKVMRCINLKTMMFLDNKKDEEFKEKCNEIIDKNIKRVLKSKKVEKMTKIKVFIFYYFFYFINIIKKIRKSFRRIKRKIKNR